MPDMLLAYHRTGARDDGAAHNLVEVLVGVSHVTLCAWFSAVGYFDPPRLGSVANWRSESGLTLRGDQT